MTYTENIPTALTPFFGRKAELHTIQSLLNDPACRLLTLTGPGGIGKTRLAMEFARELGDKYADSVYWIDLQPLSSGELLPIAINEALGITRGQETPIHHLIHFLANKQALLILDNFEHLLEYTSLLTKILVNTQQVKLLVTSRETLNLQEEWLFPIGGIDSPAGNGVNQNRLEETEPASAVQMFAACARRVRPDFSLENDIEAVVEICRSVEGMPLAIELAASWARVLPCKIIAREIKENIRFLASGIRNIPERHRSILAVFQQTWRMLSPEEQLTFQRLALFRGGFDQRAACQVTQANLGVIAALVDKSLLHHVPPTTDRGPVERFRLHGLLRQFAYEHLAGNGSEQPETADRHSIYYLHYLRQRNNDLRGGRQFAALQEIQLELENVRAAWEWAAQQGAIEKLWPAVDALDSFFQFQSRFLEGATLFEQTLAALEKLPSSDLLQQTRAQLSVILGWLYIRLGQLDQARASLEAAHKVYTSPPFSPPSSIGADPQAALAILAVLRGDYSEAVSLGIQSLQDSQTRGDDQNTATAHYALASTWLAQGKYATARQHAQETCNLAHKIKDEWLLAYGIKLLGDSLCSLGDTHQARLLYQECFRLREAFQDPEGMALALNHLGKVALLEENFSEARRFFQKSFEIYNTIFDRGGLSTSLNGLGCTALGLDDLGQARRYLLQALQIACEIHFVPLIISILVSIAGLFIKAGQPSRGIPLLNFAVASPASDQETRRQAAEKLSTHLKMSIDAVTAAAANSAPAEDLNNITEKLLIEVEALETKIQQMPAGPQSPLASETGLTEALTEREIEILRYMNEGQSNKAIANQTILSVGTIKWYTSQIYGKLQVTSRTQALARAREIGIL